jgi:hypothetical protein
MAPVTEYEEKVAILLKARIAAEAAQQHAEEARRRALSSIRWLIVSALLFLLAAAYSGYLALTRPGHA